MRSKSFVALMLFALGTNYAAAQSAQVVTMDFCDDPAAAFDVVWARGRDAHLTVFLARSRNSLVSSDPSKHFQDASTFYVSAHGHCGAVGPLSGADFAALFKSNKNNAPVAVALNSCEAAKVPNGPLSLLAKKYPGAGAGQTLVGTLTGPVHSGLLQPPPGMKVSAIEDAQYLDGGTSTGGAIVQRLMEDWGKKKYPNSTMAYKDYCATVVMPKFTDGRTFNRFVQEVTADFGSAYLDLINTNSGGVAMYKCGGAIACK